MAHITKKGLDKLQNELDQLIKIDREELKIIISDARDLGDLKENAEYHSAKEKQSLMEGRISNLQGIVAGSIVVDASEIKSHKVVFGATVNLLDLDKDTIVTYQLVGPDESDIKNNLVSYTSPLGKAILGKEEGDSVIVKAPKGDIEYEIESIKYK